MNTLRVEQGNLVLAQGTYTKTDGQTGQFGDVALTKAEVLDDHHLATLLENSGGSPTFVDNQTTTTMIDTTSTQVSDPVVQQAIDDVTNATQNIVA